MKCLYIILAQVLLLATSTFCPVWKCSSNKQSQNGYSHCAEFDSNWEIQIFRQEDSCSTEAPFCTLFDAVKQFDQQRYSNKIEQSLSYCSNIFEQVEVQRADGKTQSFIKIGENFYMQPQCYQQQFYSAVRSCQIIQEEEEWEEEEWEEEEWEEEEWEEEEWEEEEWEEEEWEEEEWEEEEWEEEEWEEEEWEEEEWEEEEWEEEEWEEEEWEEEEWEEEEEEWIDEEQWEIWEEDFESYWDEILQDWHDIKGSLEEIWDERFIESETDWDKTVEQLELIEYDWEEIQDDWEYLNQFVEIEDIVYTLTEEFEDIEEKWEYVQWDIESAWEAYEEWEESEEETEYSNQDLLAHWDICTSDEQCLSNKCVCIPSSKGLGRCATSFQDEILLYSASQVAACNDDHSSYCAIKELFDQDQQDYDSQLKGPYWTSIIQNDAPCLEDYHYVEQDYALTNLNFESAQEYLKQVKNSESNGSLLTLLIGVFLALL